MHPGHLNPNASFTTVSIAAVAEVPVLSWVGDRVHASFAGAEPIPVSLVQARPLTDPDGMIAIIDARKRCVGEVASLMELSAGSRAVARLELERRYCIAVILRVESTLVDFGSRYWQVVTDRGARRFLVRDPQRSVLRLPPDRVMLRDVQGNRFLIPSLSALDAASLLAAEPAL